MRHHGNLGGVQPFDQLDAGAPPSILTPSAPASFRKRRRFSHPLDACVIGAEGHIGDQHRPPDRPACGGCDAASLDGDRKGVVIAHHDHGKRIADQNDVDSSFVDKTRGGVIIGGKGDDRPALGLFLFQCLYGDFGRGKAAGRERSAVRNCVRLMAGSSATPVPGCCPLNTVEVYSAAGRVGKERGCPRRSVKDV